MQARDGAGVRLLWSEVATPEALAEGPARKAAEGKYKQVLREVISSSTAIALQFPAMVESAAAMDALLEERGSTYREALRRLEGMVQYELTATWAEEDGVDLAKPVSGGEYLKRHQQAEARVAATDIKLRSLTAGIVVEWRASQERRTRLWYALLARGDRERFLAALRSSGPSEGVRLRLSGPWPPSEFVSPAKSPE